jgi:hypothetical protein
VCSSRRLPVTFEPEPDRHALDEAGNAFRRNDDDADDDAPKMARQ